MPIVLEGELKSRDGGCTVDKDGNVIVDTVKEGLPARLLSSSFIPEELDVAGEAAVHFVHEHLIDLPTGERRVTWLYRIPVTSELRAIFLMLDLRPDNRDATQALVDAIPLISPWFNRAVLNVASYVDFPDATSDALVVAAIRNLQAKGIPFWWGRFLWPYTPWFDPTNPEWYTSQINVVRMEAAALGAIGSHLDAEPYASSALISNGPELDQPLWDRVYAAVNKAVRTTGPVDAVFPSDSELPLNYAWIMGLLGSKRFSEASYFMKHPQYDMAWATPPPQITHRIDTWGSWVGKPGIAPLTPKDFAAIDTRMIREGRFPMCAGKWMYADDPLGTILEWSANGGP